MGLQHFKRHCIFETDHKQSDPSEVIVPYLLFLTIVSGLVFIFALLSGCSTFSAANNESQMLDPKTYYRHDIKIKEKHSKRKGKGVITLPRQSEYDLEFETPGKVDAILITTCHRQFSTEDVKSGWLSSGKKYRYKYKPNPEMERDRSCMIRIEALEKGVDSRHSTAYIEFENDHNGYTLKANLMCNGERFGSYGVGICQSYAENPKKSLEQKIEFQVAVELNQEALPERCRIRESADGKNWTFRIRNRECTYLFRSADKKLFRLQTMGYESIALRGD